MSYNTTMEVRFYKDGTGNVPLMDWVNALPDKMARAIIKTRLVRIEASNLGDCKPVRDGVQELRIDYGPGYRVYMNRQGPMLVLLLCGSDKSNQSREIEKAIDYLTDWKQRGKP